jgi:WD40 repeat protein
VAGSEDVDNPGGVPQIVTEQTLVVEVWDLLQAKVLRKYPVTDSPGGCVLSADGRVLAWADGNTVNVGYVGKGAERVSLEGLSAFTPCLALTPDGRTLATGDIRGTIKVWDLSKVLPGK